MPNKKFSKAEIKSALDSLFKGQKIVEFSFELIEKCLSEIVPGTEIDEVTLHQLFFTTSQNSDSLLAKLQEIIIRSEQHFFSIFSSKMRAAYSLRQLIEHPNFRSSKVIEQRNFISELLKIFEYFNASHADDHAVANFIKDQFSSDPAPIKPGSLTASVAKLMQTQLRMDSYDPAIPETKNSIVVFPTISPVNNIKIEQPQGNAALSIPDQRFSLVEKNELVQQLKSLAALQERAENLAFPKTENIRFLKIKKIKNKTKRLEQIYEKIEQHMARIMELFNSITIFETDIFSYFNENCKLSEIILFALKNRPKPLYPIKEIVVSQCAALGNWNLIVDNILALANVPHFQITSITFQEVGSLGGLPGDCLPRFTDGISNFKTLENLKFSSISVDINQLALSRMIENCPSLNSIIVRSNGGFSLSEEEIVALTEAIRNKDSFSTLILDSHHLVGQNFLSLISVYQAHKNFNVLRLQGDQIGEQAGVALAQAMRLKFAKKQPGLKLLDLSNIGMTLNGVAAISNVLKDNIIWYLDLSCNNLSPPSTYKFFNFYRQNTQGFQLFLNAVNSSTALVRLDLSSSKLSHAQIKMLAQALAENTSLEILDLARNNIANEGLKLIAQALSKNKTLRELNLEYNQISDKDIPSLCEALIQNKTLKELKLNGNKLGDMGAVRISQALPLFSLSTLYLDSCGILSKGVEHIAISMRVKTATVTHLSVTGESVDNTAAEAVLQTVIDPKIRSFKIETIGITQQETKIALRSNAVTSPNCLALSYFDANKMAMPAVTKHFLNEFLIPPLIKIIVEYAVTSRDDATPDFSNSALYCLESLIVWWLDTHRSDDRQNIWTSERTKDFTSGALISSYFGDHTYTM